MGVWGGVPLIAIAYFAGSLGSRKPPPSAANCSVTVIVELRSIDPRAWAILGGLFDCRVEKY